MREQIAGRIAFVLSLALFLLITNHLAGWYVFRQMGYDSNFRFENGAHVKGEVLDLYVEYAAWERGYKIAVIGDSVVQGANVPERGQTITAHLERELRGSYLPEARVFNFGLPGGRPADLLMTAKKLHEAGAADLYVFNISYPFFSEEIAKEPLLYFKVWRPYLTPEQIVELKVPPATTAEKKPAGSAPESGEIPAGENSGEKSAGYEKPLQEFVSRHWMVYRFRQELNRYLFGGQPAAQAAEYVDAALGVKSPKAVIQDEVADELEPLSEKDKPENKYKVWHSFPWGQRDLQHLKRVYSINVADNINFKYYRELCLYLRENNIPAVIFLSPINHALLRQYNLLDYGAYGDNTAAMEQAARQSGLVIFNYQDSVHPDLFHDSLHLLDGGNAAAAKLLSADLRPVISGRKHGKHGDGSSASKRLPVNLK